MIPIDPLWLVLLSKQWEESFLQKSKWAPDILLSLFQNNSHLCVKCPSNEINTSWNIRYYSLSLLNLWKWAVCLSFKDHHTFMFAYFYLFVFLSSVLEEQLTINSLLTIFLNLRAGGGNKIISILPELRRENSSGTGETSVKFCSKKKMEGDCYCLLSSSEFISWVGCSVQEGKIHSLTHNTDAQHRAEIPSKELVLLHIHECKSGPTAIALGSEISNLGINRNSYKFLWI